MRVILYAGIKTVVYELQYDYCAFLVYSLCLFVFIKKRSIRRRQNKVFLCVIILGVLSTVFDIFGVVTASDIHRHSNLVPTLINTFYFLCHNTYVPTFAMYVILTVGFAKRMSKFKYIFYFLPYSISALLIITNPFTNLIFFYDSSMVYVRGLLMPVLYVIGFLYLLNILYVVIRYHRYIPNNQEWALIFFLVISALSVVIQFYNPSLLIEMFFQSASVMWVLISLENDSDLMSPSSGIYNRHAFVLEANTSIEAKLPFKVISIKLTDFLYYETLLGQRFMHYVMDDVARWIMDLAGNKLVYDCDNGNYAIILYASEMSNIPTYISTIMERFSKDWEYSEINIHFDTMVGEIEVPNDASSSTELVSLIDRSYQKIHGANSIISKDQLKILRRQSAVEAALQRALSAGSLQVYYQPIWDSKTGRIHSAEALVRLIDDVEGFIPPDEFIPIAEKNGMILRIGEFVFETVCRDYVRDKFSSLGISFVEVNLSTVQFMYTNLAEKFSKILADNALASSVINLEITESAAISNSELFLKGMQQLSNLGFSFSLDDYGTGYSNASYIFNMDFSIIKIDKSILWQAEQNAKAKIILQNTIRMIKQMNLKIVVEGVETEYQKKLLTQLGCDYCQGFYFCKPVPKDQFINFVRDFNRSHLF